MYCRASALHWSGLTVDMPPQGQSQVPAFGAKPTGGLVLASGATLLEGASPQATQTNATVRARWIMVRPLVPP